MEIPPTETCQKESASSNITQASKPPVAEKTKKNSLPSNNIQGYKVHTRNREVFRNIQNQNAFASKSHSISKTAFRGHSSISISKENRAGSWSQLNSFRNMTDDEVMKIKKTNTKRLPEYFPYNFFLQKFQCFVDRNSNLEEVEIDVLKANMYMIQSKQIDLYIERMLIEDKKITTYINKDGKKIMNLRIKNTLCIMCQTAEHLCAICQRRVCHNHSPDSKLEERNERHCEDCYATKVYKI